MTVGDVFASGGNVGDAGAGTRVIPQPPTPLPVDVMGFAFGPHVVLGIAMGVAVPVLLVLMVWVGLH